LRESFWDLRELHPPGHDFVLVARPEIGELLEREGFDGVSKNIGEALDAAAGKRRST
jgi:RNase P protein component